MSKTGVLFDIKQLSVFDGPGIRTTVFLKGCPLTCMWCHNPEGLSYAPQLMVSQNGCTGCGRCMAVCRCGDKTSGGDKTSVGGKTCGSAAAGGVYNDFVSTFPGGRIHPASCTLCGDCINVCPERLRKICGDKVTAEDLSNRLLKDCEYLNMMGGGVTFSGGEPLGQSEFLLECLERLRPMHRAIETSGYCAPGVFREILNELDYIIMDIKLADEEKHRYYTGVSNKVILENLEQVKSGGKPFCIRIPVIPGVNDSEDNYRQTAALLKGAGNLIMAELLPYHKTAGAKYGMVGRTYEPEFDISRTANLDTSVFEAAGIRCERM